MSTLPNRAAGSEAAPTVAVSAGHPTGTVTFAFTDIEGSTQRWERYPVAMAQALQRHDTLVRAQRETTEQATYARLMPLLHAHVSTDALARFTADGASLAPEAAVALALEESHA